MLGIQNPAEFLWIPLHFYIIYMYVYINDSFYLIDHTSSKFNGLHNIQANKEIDKVEHSRGKAENQPLQQMTKIPYNLRNIQPRVM